MSLLSERSFKMGKIKVKSHVFGDRTVYYHGTSLNTWKRIKKSKTGALLGKATQFGASKQKIVYLTTDLNKAKGYANRNKQHNSAGNAVILAIKAKYINLDFLYRDDNHLDHPYYEYLLPILKKYIEVETII